MVWLVNILPVIGANDAYTTHVRALLMGTGSVDFRNRCVRGVVLVETSWTVVADFGDVQLMVVLCCTGSGHQAI